ncbi:bifunctional methylenetetrahydrofolate dehydrogenase/methenyltetrahydrofolate cyclohydrolase FolD [Roseococcus sp. SYP-B2431]|uniref:bifunctional methylenetetrahydrofolate dehydrogenase/methenyltetrahydrofolate cyclohydrolase FolD n=1 Tax=Roseococcus sp. SYP-B2431 TaxID=2496640 RepID=UPI00103E2493|nr:bifunctional methylenetetrahydrofolate dehydrogenase/methenyltetrahydrofolate cyclohydrolase FolD [Roseococcus sp. SYP-B2431]TCH98585.1 bifunctional methylenetetrahydrofolate dehydrogenase/methenyltetrahydrofolate cyclohydrolase FolD [Roseococcus sp. SYP-B2431]
MTQILDGKAIAERLRGKLAGRVAELAFRPGLVVVRVGEDPASGVYVRNKDRAATQAGFASRTRHLPEETTEAELLAEIAALNADPEVDGILVQLPLPKHIRSEMAIAAVDPAKDVDGFHPVNAGRLASGLPGLVPCTPRGAMHLLAEAKAKLSGARAVVVGRSQIVGRPMAQLLLAADCTVTIAHSRTADLPGECRRADILIAAVGRPELIRGDWIREGAVVIDVGINRMPDGKLKGDVAYAEALPRAAAITPVPGGVGPMTIACLLENTLEAALARRG